MKFLRILILTILLITPFCGATSQSIDTFRTESGELKFLYDSTAHQIVKFEINKGRSATADLIRLSNRCDSATSSLLEQIRIKEERLLQAEETIINKDEQIVSYMLIEQSYSRQLDANTKAIKGLSEVISKSKRTNRRILFGTGIGTAAGIALGVVLVSLIK